jgi:hypothetical protein
MKKTILEIYALIICFGAVITLSINIGLAIYSIIGIASPTTTLNSYGYKNHQNNDAFWQSKPNHNYNPKTEETAPRPDEKTLTKKRLASYQLEIKAEHRSNIQNLIIQFIIIVVSSLLLLIHWLFILRKKQTVEKL